MGRNLSNHSESPVMGRGRSPSRRSHSRRKKSPSRMEKHLSHTKSPKLQTSRSPSPRTKRLRRVQAEREVDKLTDKDFERDHAKGTYREKGSGIDTDKVALRDQEKETDKNTRRERDTDRETEREKSEKETDKTLHRERDADREIERERRERRSRRDEIDGKSSKSRHGRSTSSSDHHHRRHRSRSPQLADNARERDEVSGDIHSFLCVNEDDDSVARMKAAEEALEAKEKQKPSFELSGKLAAETNRVRGVTLLFSEPADARKPDMRWRLYVFKGGEVLNEPLYIHRQTCYLFGRERRVADIPTDHPSCSKQHAVIQYRQVEKEQPDGTLSKQVRPYLMDLGSTNKTFINEDPIEPERYYELFERDTIKFGNSSREYVLLHENSAG
ncbi:FHA domain-containing protein [Cephalotus follicularis]|uniref:FHA domain-containing protein n=1 Tax=Cephalotus follicularis TaxID=3775 RepID=A0A1Q3BKS8_CEPFO|nr:FHA domain-containing protein [Cephalotus follicularis]